LKIVETETLDILIFFLFKKIKILSKVQEREGTGNRQRFLTNLICEGSELLSQNLINFYFLINKPKGYFKL
jgi:hypothetical protein